jgi:lipopolysaccharide transport system ATP-binding protein
MKDVSVNDGRTVLFVSHNMAAVKQLCTTGIVMKNGGVIFDGLAMPTVDFYQTSHDTDSYFEHQGAIEDAPGNENIRLLNFEVEPTTGEVISISSGINFKLKFYNHKEDINLDATFELRNLDEVVVFHHGALISVNRDSKRGVYTVIGTLNPNLLNAGNYSFKMIFGENQRYALLIVEDLIRFEVVNEINGSNSQVLPGVIRPDITYEISIA